MPETCEAPLTHGQARQLAVDYYDNGKGWSIERIRGRLADRGLRVGWTTIRRWVMTEAEAERSRADEAARARRHYRDVHGLKDARVFDEDALRRRVTALDRVGVQTGSIAAVIYLDHGIVITAKRVTAILAGDPLPPSLRKALAHAA